jgi:hypothetical protein
MDTAASSTFEFESASGDGFAIPINEVEKIASEIRSGTQPGRSTSGRRRSSVSRSTARARRAAPTWRRSSPGRPRRAARSRPATSSPHSVDRASALHPISATWSSAITPATASRSPGRRRPDPRRRPRSRSRAARRSSRNIVPRQKAPPSAGLFRSRSRGRGEPLTAACSPVLHSSVTRWIPRQAPRHRRLAIAALP